MKPNILVAKMYFRMMLAMVVLVLGMTMPVSAQTKLTKHYDDRDGLSSPHVRGVVQDRNGLIWLATWNGLNCYDGYEFHWVKIQPGDHVSGGTDHIRNIMLSPEGNIWCYTDGGSYEYNISEHRFQEIPQAKRSLVEKRLSKGWHSTTDLQGNEWTLSDFGVDKSYTPHHSAKVIEGTADGDVRALMVDKEGYLWVSLRSAKQIKIYSKDYELVRTLQLASPAYTLYQTRNGDVWVGCKPALVPFRIARGGVSGINVPSEEVQTGGKTGGSGSKYAVYDITADAQGHLWIATFGEGVKCCINPNAENPQFSEGFGGERVRNIIVTKAGNIIAATTEGLLFGHIDEKNVSKTVLRQIARDDSDPNSLCSNALMNVAQNGNGDIFITTECSGVDMISEEALMGEKPQFTHLNTKTSTLLTDVCNAIALLNDSIFTIVGNDNVMAYNLMDKQTINLSRAFWGEECNFNDACPVLMHDGSWVWAARQGALVASNKTITQIGYVPKLVFTTLSVNGGASDFCLPSRKVVLLGTDERNVTISFAAVDYINNTDILYRTRMDGGTWTTARDDRNITIFDLTPGRHTIEVQSTDAFGRWVDNNATLTFTVEAYWYETWWGSALKYLLVVCIVGAIIYLIIYIRRVNRQRAELLEKYMAVIAADQKPEVDNVKESSSAGIAIADDDAIADDKGEEIAEMSEADKTFLNRVRKYIDDNIANPDANVDDMAAAAAASRSTLNRRLNSLLGISAAQLLIDARMQRAQQLLLSASNDRTIADIATCCGYSDVHYFQRVFKKKHGVTPAEFRSK